MKQDEIPTPEFQENDVDCLIASYGKKPDAETLEKMYLLLRREMENPLTWGPVSDASERGATVSRTVDGMKIFSPLLLPEESGVAEGCGKEGFRFNSDQSP